MNSISNGLQAVKGFSDPFVLVLLVTALSRRFKMLTQERLKELLHYDPDTGLLHRKTSIRGANKGDVAGKDYQGGYLMLSVDSKAYLVHRLIFLYIIGKPPDRQVDHINHIRSDNRWCNLRDVTQSENQRNALMMKRNKSGFTGVSWNIKSKKWQVTIMIDRKNKNLGHYKSKEDAIKARIEANKKYGYSNGHGDRL